MTASRTWAALAAVLLLGFAGCGEQASSTTPGPRFPEEELVFPISNITVTPTRTSPMKAVAEALDILAEIRGGRPFAEVARQRSQDEGSAQFGGFMGFYRGSEDDSLNAAVQAVPIGAVSSVVESPSGVHLIHRHEFDEARALEAQQAVAAYGLFVPWAKSVRPAQRSREEAQDLATRLTQELQSGTKDLAAAYEEVHGQPPERADCLIGVVRDLEAEREFYSKIRSVPVGSWLPPTNFPGGFTVVRRGRLLRTLVRQILVQHVQAPDRQLAVQRSKVAARQLAEQALAEAKPDGSNWAELVTRFSDDVISQPLEGYIGCVTNGDLMAPLETALLETPPGTIHPHLIETERGFHILYPVK